MSDRHSTIDEAGGVRYSPPTADVIEVHYLPTIPDRELDSHSCRHDPAHLLDIHGRIENGKTAADGSMCLACGAVVACQFDTWLAAWQAAWNQHGWHIGIGKRLMEFIWEPR